MQILEIDIETAPNKVFTWDLWNTTIAPSKIEESGYTLCWSAKWRGSRELMFSSVRDGIMNMLRGIHRLMDEADAIVHYNGKKFDIPTLNKEFIMHDMKPPSPAHQIDLYHVVRSNFRFQSNKLDYVCAQLGIGEKLQHKGVDLWKGCMNGDEASWRTMERYNKQDVRLLDGLYGYLLPWIQNHPNHALYSGQLNRPRCPNCGSSHVQSRGIATTKTGVYTRFKCMNTACGKWLRSRLTQTATEDRANILVGIH